MSEPINIDDRLKSQIQQLTYLRTVCEIFELYSPETVAKWHANVFDDFRSSLSRYSTLYEAYHVPLDPTEANFIYNVRNHMRLCKVIITSCIMNLKAVQNSPD